MPFLRRNKYDHYLIAGLQKVCLAYQPRIIKHPGKIFSHKGGYAIQLISITQKLLFINDTHVILPRYTRLM